jgi:hypothetical protein
MLTGASWDLAAFITNPGTLGVLSGYNLRDGFGGYTIGDIFINTTTTPGTTVYPDPNTPYPALVKNGTGGTSGFNFDFALRMNFVTGEYTVIELDADTVLENTSYSGAGNYNAASNPVRVASTTGGISGGNLGTVLGTYSMTYTDTQSAAVGTGQAGFAVTSDYKYYAELQQMTWLNPYLPANNLATYHLTMECGNDDLYGVSRGGFLIGVSEGSMTLALLGSAFLALSGFRRYRTR